jgi:adenylate cyclase
MSSATAVSPAADEERVLARLRALRSDLIDPTIAVHRGRIVKRTGDGSIIEFRSVVDAVRCAIEVQSAMVERNAAFRTGSWREIWTKLTGK